MRGSDNQPAIGTVRQVLRWKIHAGKTRVFYVPADPPTRVELTVDPTFSPYDYGGGDRRQLGAQVAYSFTDRRPS